jgi:hypothetical protein
MVSNKKYKETLKLKELYQKYYYEEQNTTNSQRLRIIYLNDENKRFSDYATELKVQIDEYKQKFLDEQQKRLELAELVARLEGDRK